jgi:hypothetical protein
MLSIIEPPTVEPASTAAQPFLFSELTIAGLTTAEKHGRFTLERLRKLRPEAIDEIIRLRGEFVGKLRIAEIVHVHHETVTAVDAAYPEAIDIAREARVARLRSAGDKLVEQIDQNPGLVPWGSKALSAGQLYARAELLDGKATSRVEHVEKIDTSKEAWDAYLDSMLEADVSEVEPAGMGLEAGKFPAVGSGAPPQIESNHEPQGELESGGQN